MAEPVPLDLYYDNLSEFHGNGERVFYSARGIAVAECYDGHRGQKISVRLYRAQLAEPDRRRINEVISASRGEDIAIRDRAGIPDEVRDHFAVRSSSGVLRSFDLWEDDWSKQQPEVGRLKAAALDLLKILKRQKPADSLQIRSAGHQPPAFWPPEFSPDLKP